MRTVKMRFVNVVIGCTIVVALVPAATAQPLTIHEIQFNTSDGDASVYDGQVVDCVGGVCVAKFGGYRPRLILQDPAHPDGWGGIQVKDWTIGDLFDHVNVGDWVQLANMLVEEFRGATHLQWQTAYDPGFTIVSEGNPVPPPLPVAVGEIPAPLYDPGDDGWYVENHDAEPYESMRLIVHDVTVAAMDLGKAVDNYDLEDADGASCWAADYMNEDVGPWGYHPFVSIGQHFCGVSGIFEQYTNLANGWDYYQLVTLTSADLAICGDVDHDGDVDLSDLAQLLANYRTASGACYEDGDLDYDGDVDLSDLALLLSVYGTAIP